MQKYFNISMIKYDDIIGVKFAQIDAEAVSSIGCAVDILAGSTIKAAKFYTDLESSDTFLSNLAFRLQPVQEFYDTTHSYSQNGDIYSVGYDNDFYDGTVEYTANGYPA